MIRTDDLASEPFKCKSCKGTGKVSGDRPSHYNYICGMGVDPDRFDLAFRDIGKIQHGPLTRNRNA